MSGGSTGCFVSPSYVPDMRMEELRPTTGEAKFTIAHTDSSPLPVVSTSIAKGKQRRRTLDVIG